MVVKEITMKKDVGNYMKQRMSKVKILSIVYAIGIIIGALYFDVWGVDTTPFKTMSIFAWTVIFIVALFYVDKSERK